MSNLPLRSSWLMGVKMATVVNAMLLALPAHGEGWLRDAEFGIATGAEGGDAPGGLSWRRARTRILGGIELRSDESASEGLGMRVFVELERRASLGGELRYTWWSSPRWGTFGGAVFVLAPESLYGGDFGVRGLIPLGPTWGVFVEPSVSVFPLGTDVPDRSLVLWGALSLGVRYGI